MLAVGVCLMGSIGCRDWGRFEGLGSGGGPSGGGGDGAGSQGGSGAGGPLGGGSVGGGSVGGGSVGGSGSGGGPSECGTIDVLSDDFEAASFDWRWRNYGTAFTLEGGDLVLTLPAGVEDYFQLESTAAFDMRGRSVVFELIEPPTLGQGYWLNVAGDPSNYVEFYVNFGGTLEYSVEVDDVYSSFASEPFDPVDHRFFRFRESEGTIFYETSPDGTAWTERTDYDLTGVFDPEFTRIYFGGNTGVDSPGCSVRVARVFVEPASTGDTCGIASLTDDFDDGVRGNVWGEGWSSGCDLDEGSGALRLSCMAGSSASAAYGTSTAYDLTGSSVSVAFTDPPAPGEDSYMAFIITRPEADTLYTIQTGGSFLEVYEVIDGSWSQVVSLPFDLDAMRVVRFSEAEGQLSFAYSADGVSFTTFHQRPPAFSLTELQILLAGGNESDTVASDMAFDDLNLVP